jgi:rubrerythrin
MAKQLGSLRDIIGYATAKEQEAQALYRTASEAARLLSSRNMLLELAQFEARHEQALRELDPTSIPDPPSGRERDLRIAEFLREVDLDPEADFQTILIHAMKREEKSRDFYMAMADNCAAGPARKLFETLADQESRHKKALETIYDDEILREN